MEINCQQKDKGAKSVELEKSDKSEKSERRRCCRQPNEVSKMLLMCSSSSGNIALQVASCQCTGTEQFAILRK